MQLVDSVVNSGRNILNAEQKQKKFESVNFLNIVDEIVNTGKYVVNS